MALESPKQSNKMKKRLLVPVLVILLLSMFVVAETEQEECGVWCEVKEFFSNTLSGKAVQGPDDPHRRNIPTIQDNYISPIDLDTPGIRILSHGPQLRRDPVEGEEERYHDGVDIAVAAGTDIRAVANGKVRYVAEHPTLGNVVIYQDATGIRHLYAHMEGLPDLQVGQEVVQGQIVGKVGATGRVTGAHLHYETTCKTAKCQSLSQTPEGTVLKPAKNGDLVLYIDPERLISEV